MFANTRDVYQDVSAATFEAICSLSFHILKKMVTDHEVSLDQALRPSLFGSALFGWHSWMDTPQMSLRIQELEIWLLVYYVPYGNQIKQPDPSRVGDPTWLTNFEVVHPVTKLTWDKNH